MDAETQNNFIDFLEKEEFVMLDNKNKMINEPQNKNMYGFYLYKIRYGNVFFRQDNIIDSIKSPVIQFSKTIVKDEIKKIKRGRLWMQDSFSKEGVFVRKDETFIKDYNKIVRWIKKNVPYQEVDKEGFVVREYVNNKVKLLHEEGYSLTI